MRIRFHLDEHIPASVAAGLRRRGIDVTTTIEAGLTGADDRTQLAFAAASERVLVTHDAARGGRRQQETPGRELVGAGARAGEVSGIAAHRWRGRFGKL